MIEAQCGCSHSTVDYRVSIRDPAISRASAYFDLILRLFYLVITKRDRDTQGNGVTAQFR